MNSHAYSAELAAAMEAGFIKNPNTGEYCHSLAGDNPTWLLWPTVPYKDIEEREEYDRLVAWSLEKRDVSPGEVVMTFNYIGKAVRVAMKVAQRRGEVGQHGFLY